ncbi:ferredoxin reductase [Rhodococcus sp. G-MC3]|uniref:ferredoxin reductase n=1 Tax=Rhodococcus sp. G-MC3 TaxID=3046209 RepID=UPI0024B94977|nr:ferredoxin reductase [Rhodococcus sp. G-MC3]MDJ0395185.1 ferredoxin reductase [Rhodococcus sp. G-MC3]
MDLKKWLEAPAADVSAPKRPKLNMLRGAITRITTPLLPDDYLHLANPLWSARELRGRVVEVKQETATAVTLVIQPGWGFNFDYQPGQYIGIGLHLGGRWHWRSYSLTSPPNWDEKRISITVKAMPEGFLSSHLVGGVPQGTIVRLNAPKGNFALPTPPPDKILFITAGSGITPIISMLRTLDRHGDMPDTVHIHSAPTEDEVMFGDELTTIAAGHQQFQSHIQLTRSDGKFALASLDGLYPDWRTRETWACGPAALLEDLERVWKQEGIENKLHLERFEIARADTSGKGGKVTFSKSDRSADIDGATSLLEAGENLGVQMPFGCRMGICQSCVVPLTSGHVIDLRSGKEHGEGERIQTCISAAAGDCTLEL